MQITYRLGCGEQTFGKGVTVDSIETIVCSIPMIKQSIAETVFQLEEQGFNVDEMTLDCVISVDRNYIKDCRRWITPRMKQTRTQRRPAVDP